MTTETSVQNLKINTLTSAQYNTITPSSTELYMITDDNSYQEKLVSGTNIKTINNESILGSGNITIQGGGLSYSTTNPAITPSSGIATWTVTHNLNSTAVQVALYANGEEVEKNVTITSANVVTISFPATSSVTAGSYTVVVLASGATSDTSNLANINLSNLSTTGNKVIDGQWVSSFLSLFNAEGYPKNSGDDTVIDLSTYLPNDNYCYEVLMQVEHYKNAVNGQVRVELYSGLVSDLIVISSISGANVRYDTDNILSFPISGTHKFYIRTISWSTQGQLIIRAFAYRRLGTNS